jgi:hypothetical protein
VPHSIAVHREDIDKRSFPLSWGISLVDGAKCIVYDAVFHPTALRLAKNERFKTMIVTTALEGIEQRFPQHRLSRDLKYPKMDFKVL